MLPAEIITEYRTHRDVFGAVCKTLKRYDALPEVATPFEPKTVSAIQKGACVLCFPHTPGLHDSLTTAGAIGQLLERVTNSPPLYLAMEYHFRELLDPKRQCPQLLSVEGAGKNAEQLFSQIISLFTRRCTNANILLVRQAIRILKEGANFATAPNGGRNSWYDTLATILMHQKNPETTVVFVYTEARSDRNFARYTPFGGVFPFKKGRVTFSEPVPIGAIRTPCPDLMTQTMERAYHLWGEALALNPQAPFAECL
jgi:hypothetical protein